MLVVKVHSLSDGKGNHVGWMIFCPACKCGHLFDSRWTFNGDREKPTFRASMLIHHKDPSPMPDGSMSRPTLQCHSFVTEGRIEFLGDCEHALRGQTVDLPDFE